MANPHIMCISNSTNVKNNFIHHPIRKSFMNMQPYGWLRIRTRYARIREIQILYWKKLKYHELGTPSTRDWYHQPSSPPRNRCDVFPPTTTSPHEDININQYQCIIYPPIHFDYYVVFRVIVWLMILFVCTWCSCSCALLFFFFHLGFCCWFSFCT